MGNIDIALIIAEYDKLVGDLSKEVVYLKAYIKQLEAEKSNDNQPTDGLPQQIVVENEVVENEEK
jgi:hypothetical protein